MGNEISIDITGLRGLRISRAKVGQQEIKEKFKIHAGNTRFYFVTEDMIHDTKKTIAHHGSRDDVLSFISRLVTRRVELPHIGPIIISGESGAGKSFLLR